MPIPCCPKKVGSQLTKPKISVLAVISTTQPTTSRGSKAGLNSEAKVQSGVGTAGAARGQSPAHPNPRPLPLIPASPPPRLRLRSVAAAECGGDSGPLPRANARGGGAEGGRRGTAPGGGGEGSLAR